MQAQGQPKRIYLAGNDHTDLFWTADLRTCQKGFINMIDYYLDRADATDTRPAACQARFCCDGNYWMWVYEKGRSREQFLRLIRRIRDGHITVNLAPLCVSPGGMPAEAIIRGMYYPGRIERAHGVRFLVAHSCENPTYPLGLASLWAGSGARYAWGGNFGGDTRVPAKHLRNRKREIFWWVGRGGRKVLMKWPSLVGGDSVGGYAEARRPANVVEYLTTNKAFLRRYPYPVVSAFGKGWDDLETLTDELETVAAGKTRPGRKVYVSNQVDFFQDFEKTCGRQLPRVSESYGNEWDLYVAALAGLSARLKRATERLRSAEALAVIVSLRQPGFMAGRKEAREQAWVNMGLYPEHDINMMGKGEAAKRKRLDWQVRLVREVEAYVNRLHDDGVAALGAMIPKGTGSRFFVFNPLSWQRTDAADLPCGGRGGAHVIDLATGREVPSQPLTVGGGKYLRILAEGVPAVGYKVYEVRKGAGRKFPQGPGVSGGVIENRHYRVAVSPRGAVTSLIDKAQGGRELVKSIGGYCINDLGPSGGNLVAENVGCVSATLRATADRPLAHTTRVTLFGGCRRIEIRNEITQGFDEAHAWRFAFNLPSPDVWHEECGTVLRARPVTAGGHYATWAARVDWLTLNHFADMGAADGVGVTLSNADCCFMKLGRSSYTSLDANTPRISVLAGGRVGGNRGSGIASQGGDRRFLQRFALRTRARYGAPEAMRFALEHQNPLVAGAATGPTGRRGERSFSLLGISKPQVVLWALKPAEEGIARGVIARVWNLADSPVPFVLRFAGGMTRAKRTTHIETDLEDAQVTKGALAETLAGNRMQTYRLVME